MNDGEGGRDASEIATDGESSNGAGRGRPAVPPAVELAGDERAPSRRDPREGRRLVGVVRARGWRAWPGESDDLIRIRYRDVEAVTELAPFALPPLRSALVEAHQRQVERIMRRATILPAPYGVVFRDRRAVQGFLEDQYLSLDEGLSLVHGHWELRLHILHAGAGEPDEEADDRAMEAYAELRRRARAAIPFPQAPGRLLSAAFLVPRSSWIDFIEHAESFGSVDAGLSIDVTGPWPPYDFVRLSP